MRHDTYYYVYIMTNRWNTVLYIGVTNNLQRRVEEHRTGSVQGFTSRYHLTKLVYFEQATEVLSAIEREKVLKGWIREKKDTLISTMNPRWEDLSSSIMG